MRGDAVLVVRAEEASVRIGSFGPVHIVVYVDTPTVADVRLSHRHHLALMAERTEPTALLSVIPVGLGLPSGEVRKSGAEMLKEVQSQIRCMATVVEGSGFWASAIRSALTGIQLVVRNPRPNRAFARVEEAARYVTDHYRDSPVTADRLAGAVDRLRPPASQ